MPPRRRVATSTTPGTPSSNNQNVVEKNGLLTPAESVSTPVRARSTRALKKTDSGLTPASTVAGSVKDDTEDDLMGSVRKEVYVELPSLSKRSTRTAAVNRPSYVIDSDEELAMEDKKPIIKDFGARKRKAITTDSELSDLDNLDSLKPKTSTTASTTSSRAPTRQSSTSTAKRARTQSTSKPALKSRRKSLSIDAEIVPDSEGFTASEEEEAYEEFAGDDEEVDFVPRVTLKEKAAAKKAAAGATKGKGKAKAGVKGKAGVVKVEEIDDDLDVEDEMLKAAIAESLKGFEQPKAGSSKAGSSKQVTARSKEAEKRARAAERRMGIRDDRESEFSLGPDSEEDDEDFHMSGLDDDDDVKPSFVTRKNAGNSDNIPDYDHGAIMGLKKMRQKRAAENKRRRDEAAPLQKIKQEMIKKLKRKLTWAEINQIALSYHHPELKNVWGDLKAKLEPVKPTTMEAHPSLKLTLLPFQKESLYWMKQQEKGPWKGGMLADEMGMGKTIQTIALLLSEPRRKPSLVVAPVVALMQWKHEIEKNAEGFTVCLWHGTGRLKADDLKKFDVVMVSYGTLEASFRKQQKGFKRGDMIIKEKSPMHSVKWHRVILDEAHNIKERSTNAAKAAFALDASYRWCLSGTPLQNRVGELYSLVRFLGGDPFAFYYCKRCPCKSLHWQFGNKRNCDDCGHSPMQHTCYWNNEILTPIQKYGMNGPGSDAFKKLKILLDRCMLRRTKIERADDLGLPPRTITVKRGYFSPEERELYMSLFSETRRQFSTYIAEGTILNNYSNVFSLITRMRQMACHPDLVLRSKTSKYVQTEEEAVCRLCHDTAEDAIVSKCNHLFDRECISQYMLGHAEDAIPVCPVCHIELTIDLQAEAVESGEQKKLKKQGILGRLDLTNWRSSTKLEMLVDELCELRDKDCNIKSLVFSQFVSMLDLAAFRLQRAGFNICRLEGGMSPQARDATIQHFMKNPQVTVFLISLKAGGVALNLTEASQVFLLDSWWNPSVEYQSMDRIHRLGQHRPVQVTKLVVEDSIEAKILQLQDKKLAMTQAALATDPDSALGKLTEDDMQFLFRL